MSLRAVFAVLLACIAHLVAARGSVSLPKYLQDPRRPWDTPWHGKTAENVNPDHIPHTGVTRKYNFTVSRGVVAPDGVERPVILVNNEFPGPMIEANWGDMIEVTVTNNIVDPAEGTTIHWHGLRMLETPWFDGVPSTVQCPIAPGKSLTYTFQADAWGTSFWHSHYSAQYSAGTFGAIVVYGPQTKGYSYDEDLGPVFLSDWYHLDYVTVVESVVGLPAPKTQAYSDNNLINGRMNYDCTNANITANNLKCTSDAPLAQFRFQSGKKYRLRIMNASSQGSQKFMLDGHKITVIALDFTPVEPFEVDVLTIGIGQRADVIIQAVGKPTASAWMRADIDPTCSVSLQPYALAAVYYEDADASLAPNTTKPSYEDSDCGDLPLNLGIPLWKMNPPSAPSMTLELDMKFQANSSGNVLWYVNNQTFRADYEHPVMLLAKSGNTSYPNPDWLVYNTGKAKSIRVILNNYSFTNHSQHPMHLHGHNFWVVADGLGTWDGVANLDNPVRRDTYTLRPGDAKKGPGYMVIDFVLDNPGVWPLHCHLAWHVSAGLYVNILERPDEIRKLKVPQSVYQTCKDWTNYKGVDLVPEIDSGV